MIELSIFLILVTLGYVFGRIAEKKHYHSIIKREKELLDVPVVTLRSYAPLSKDVDSALVAGNVVISIDHFKKLIAGLRNFFGGRLTSYETLLDRARREALLRMKESAIKQGATAIINTRIETSSIGKGKSGNGSIGSVEVLAYGTALIPLQSNISPNTNENDTSIDT